jgi:hypothetical protein
MRIDLTIFTTPLLYLFNMFMGKSKNIEKKSKEKTFVEKQERARGILEKLGFAQMMFDFYMAQVE